MLYGEFRAAEKQELAVRTALEVEAEEQAEDAELGRLTGGEAVVQAVHMDPKDNREKTV